ncbi:hypothetical protein Scep_016932 [Stephania cephalantha]|uniref:Uncharacterized protein n=1 Tax=Stephania cephalantha TaxID=152367 RepID=A0AAP0NUL8_9MAGN
MHHVMRNRPMQFECFIFGYFRENAYKILMNCGEYMKKYDVDLVEVMRVLIEKFGINKANCKHLYCLVDEAEKSKIDRDLQCFHHINFIILKLNVNPMLDYSNSTPWCLGVVSTKPDAVLFAPQRHHYGGAPDLVYPQFVIIGITSPYLKGMNITNEEIDVLIEYQ